MRAKKFQNSLKKKKKKRDYTFKIEIKFRK